MKATIYRITFPDDTFYIGRTDNYYYRWGTHIQDARKGRHYNSLIQDIWNEYGDEDWEFEILLELEGDVSYISLMEASCIEGHPNLVNNRQVWKSKEDRDAYYYNKAYNTDERIKKQVERKIKQEDKAIIEQLYIDLKVDWYMNHKEEIKYTDYKRKFKYDVQSKKLVESSL